MITVIRMILIFPIYFTYFLFGYTKFHWRVWRDWAVLASDQFLGTGTRLWVWGWLALFFATSWRFPGFREVFQFPFFAGLFTIWGGHYLARVFSTPITCKDDYDIQIILLTRSEEEWLVWLRQSLSGSGVPAGLRVPRPVFHQSRQDRPNVVRRPHLKNSRKDL